MKVIQYIVCAFCLFTINTPIQCEEYLTNKSISIESSLNVLKILTNQQSDFQPFDIDANARINIPDALYPLMIHANMIPYEIHQINGTYYLLNHGKTFAGFIHTAERNDFVLNPDACPAHYGFLWSIIPFVSNTNACVMQSSIEKTLIHLSFFGNMMHENLMIGSFNVSMQIYTNIQSITGAQIDIQIVTSDKVSDQTPIRLFNIQSQYLYDVPLIDPPNTRGDTGNFLYIRITGRSFDTYWIPKNNPDLNIKGLSFIHMPGAKNLAVGHDHNIKYPDCEFTFTSAETIYFDGQYDITNTSNINALNVSISPYIMVDPGHMYRIGVSFLSNP
jgi:hypothetical protein